MTAPGHGSVSYLCPRCHAALTAQAHDAGQRHACPQCGKMVKVPGTPKAAGTSPTAPPEPAAARPTAAVERGIANIGLVCPLCGTRMYATRDQVGKSMVCPDCLETVDVPDAAVTRRTESSTRPTRTSRSVPPAPPNPTTPPPAATEDPDGELKLSDPVTIPSDCYLPKHLTDALREASTAPPPDASRQPGAAPAPAVPAKPSPDKGPVVHNEFAIKCPTCDTLIYATEDEIGQQRTCPDCLSVVEITRPRLKPRRVNQVVDEDYEGQLFALSDPVPRDVDHCTERGLEPRTMGEDALRKAEQEYELRKQGEPALPPIPLWDGLFRFLPDIPILVRLLFAGLLLGGVTKLTILVAHWAQGESPATNLLTMIGTVGILILTALSFAFIGTTCLVILQDSAHGRDRITEWPEMSPGDWIVESFSVAIPALYAVLPGLILFFATGVVGMPLTTRWIFLGLSLYLFFPVLQLSALESGSLMMPVSPLIIKSLSSDFLLWCTLYLMTFAIGLIVALTLCTLRAGQPILVLMLLGVVWALAIFLFYRLLGRLAWACQERFLEKADAQPHEPKGQ